MDSSLAVQVIEGCKEQDSLAAVLVDDIRRLKGGFIAFSIQHTVREGNRAADFMAEIGHNLPTGTTIFDSPPPGLITFLEENTSGVAFLVLINAGRYERHIAVSPYCPRCDDAIEIPLHLLRDCPYAVQAMASNIFVQTKVPIWISWHRPDPPFCKLNTDGSRMQETGLASAVDCCAILREPLFKVIEGSKEQDSLAAMLVDDIRRLKGGFIAFSIQHTLREGNRATDFMAEIGHNLPTGTTVFDSPPPGDGEMLSLGLNLKNLKNQGCSHLLLNEKPNHSDRMGERLLPLVSVWHSLVRYQNCSCAWGKG
ncbi:hypothetical protein SLEP1_g23635 [Rubroshorea leprosula]|uniref:RNase H type-1 domain-containing protein n=1 Tax=Rubroshorea leprosula TaxID=152421 RepID=A0AAV5JI92_9ROSI|nr:hypothetical protein SLEP1_g23635 [Rubroshorea leprosula]